jgi:hypothetical protein
VPYFVAWKDGQPDFKTVDATRTITSYQDKLCFICGQRLGAYKAFVIGPMSMVNQVSAEPPSHVECAQYALRTCPFLVNSQRKRRPSYLFEGETFEPGSVFFEHNPGVMALWVTKTFRAQKQEDGLMFALGEPVELEWWCQGRMAGRAEVADAFERGVAALQTRAPAEVVVKVLRRCETAKKFWPPGLDRPHG